MSEGFSIGIDLGTTNSLAAHVGASGEPEILQNAQQSAITPSVVGLDRVRPGRERQVLVGQNALHGAARDPVNTIRSVKRFMGRRISDPDIEVQRSHVRYRIEGDPVRDGALVIRLGDALYTPEEISARILTKVREDAESRLGGPVTHAVITVPAYFLESQRVATVEAGRSAGLTVKALLDEPTAAALSELGDDPEGRERVLVVDFGGGTLDISLVQRAGGNLNVLTYTGDNHLGGDDIDRKLVDVFKDVIRSQGGQILPDDHRLEHLLVSHAETAKKTLSAGAEEATIIIPAACRNKDGQPFDLEMEVTQADFEGVIDSLAARMEELVRELLKGQSMRPERIDRVLMVGGTSAVPRFFRVLQQIFEADGQSRVRLARSPMEAVAKGAAIYARMIRGLRCIDPRCGTVNDVGVEACTACGRSLQMAPPEIDRDAGPNVVHTLPRSLGVSYRSGNNPDAYQILLQRGLPYPTKTPCTEQFRVPSRQGFAVRIYEGDVARASSNHHVSTLKIDQVPVDVEEGDPIEVSFSYDRNRTLFVSLRFPSSKQDFRPRWELKAPGPEDGRGKGDPIRDLMEIVGQARQFLESYHDFISKGDRLKLREDIERAQVVLSQGASKAKEAKELAVALSALLGSGCGTASVLFMAEHTIARNDDQLGGAIDEKARQLRQQFAERHAEAEQTRSTLEGMVARALNRRNRERAPDLIDDLDQLYR